MCPVEVRVAQVERAVGDNTAPVLRRLRMNAARRVRLRCRDLSPLLMPYLRCCIPRWISVHISKFRLEIRPYSEHASTLGMSVFVVSEFFF